MAKLIKTKKPAPKASVLLKTATKSKASKPSKKNSVRRVQAEALHRLIRSPHTSMKYADIMF
jgi:hypothetical protein